uniref:Uncharacterized protein n=1 Tax=Anguilla anguilla TaxID=7936 RepID=A0A0E9TNV4_ANGAN
MTLSPDQPKFVFSTSHGESHGL